jgi:hypothetical protein
MQTLWQDLRCGVRMLMKQKGVTAIAVLSLALGIGANTSLFSIVDAMLLKTLPVKEPQRLALFQSEVGKNFRFGGYSGNSITRHFPDISREAAARRKESRQQQCKETHRILEQILTSHAS